MSAARGKGTAQPSRALLAWGIGLAVLTIASTPYWVRTALAEVRSGDKATAAGMLTGLLILAGIAIVVLLRWNHQRKLAARPPMADVAGTRVGPIGAPRAPARARGRIRNGDGGPGTSSLGIPKIDAAAAQVTNPEQGTPAAGYLAGGTGWSEPDGIEGAGPADYEAPTSVHTNPIASGSPAEAGGHRRRNRHAHASGEIAQVPAGAQLRPAPTTNPETTSSSAAFAANPAETPGEAEFGGLPPEVEDTVMMPPGGRPVPFADTNEIPVVPEQPTASAGAVAAITPSTATPAAGQPRQSRHSAGTALETTGDPTRRRRRRAEAHTGQSATVSAQSTSNASGSTPARTDAGTQVIAPVPAAGASAFEQATASTQMIPAIPSYPTPDRGSPLAAAIPGEPAGQGASAFPRQGAVASHGDSDTNQQPATPSSAGTAGRRPRRSELRSR